jgi:putative transposase
MYMRAARRYGAIIPGSEIITSFARRGKVSARAKLRLDWFDYFNRCRNVRLTCRHFGISPQTFYRWRDRFDPYDLTTLEEESRRPKRVRSPQTPPQVVERILELRNRYPRWGKKKLVVLLEREGIRIGESSVGRVLRRLRARGVLVEPLNVRLAREARKRRRKPRYAIRKPAGYRIDAPGDLVQVDTLHLRLQSDDRRFQFSARDALSRWDCARAYRKASSFNAVCFLEYMERKFPFPIQAIQIDGGSEFKSHFEEACLRKKIRLFVAPPRSPKVQGKVERSNRTYREEYYEVEDIPLQLEKHNHQLERYLETYNYVRPHQALDYQTPNEYYRSWLNSHSALASRM